MSILVVIFLFLLPLSVQAETNIITSEATYIMGDGESPSFAEAMALQKAKQAALEEAGTYVQSYTKTINEDLTADEIQTIAGGVIQVEVLEKTRALVQEGLRLYVKIKATVTTDKMEELARRIKGTHAAEEYKGLQESYARLSKDIEVLKKLLASTPSGQQRDRTVEQIQEKGKAFARSQKDEAALFHRLVSGEALVRQAVDQKAEIDRLVQKVMEEGYVIEIGNPKAESDPRLERTLEVTIPISVTVSAIFKLTLSQLAALLGGEVHFSDKLQVQYEKSPGLGLPSFHETSGALLLFTDKSPLQEYAYNKLHLYKVWVELSFVGSSKKACTLDEWIIADGYGVIGEKHGRAIPAIRPTDHSGDFQWKQKEKEQIAALKKEIEEMSHDDIQNEMAKRKAGQGSNLMTPYDPQFQELPFKGNSIALFVGMSSKIQLKIWPDILKKLEKITSKLVPPSQWLRPKDNERFGSCSGGMIFSLPKQKTR